jgi:C-terminal processing protease CtpA/Prc
MLSAPVGDFALTPDGENLLFTAQIDDKWGLWLTKIRERSTAQILTLGDQNPGAIELLKDGKSAVMMQGGGRIVKIDLGPALGNGGGKATSKPVAFAAEMQIDGPRERDYIFEHAWRQTRHKFYDPKLHGVDWQAMKENYQTFLPSINNNHDFADLLGELLGELNASHTGGRYRPRGQDGDQTASFGLIYDQNHQDIGLRVAEVIKNGPCDTAECQIKPGVVITHLDGVRLTPDIEPWKLLNRKVDKPVRLGLHDPAANREWEEVIRPINLGEEGNLLYERWIATRRELCEKLSGGRVGYVHVRGMNDASFRRVYSEVLGLNAEKEALIVDTRFNGGGWLHEDLATFLSGDRYCYFAPRDHEKGDLGGEPINKWVRPVAVLQSESNYSDAHFFPWAFKAKKIGKLIGAPVPGTATAVWWETQIDNSIVFGIPQVGMITLDGSYLENLQLEPDVLVYNNPGDVAAGKDPQLEKAVEVLLEDLKTVESPK